MQVMAAVVNEGLRPEFPAHTPDWYASLAAACWQHDPAHRYAAVPPPPPPPEGTAWIKSASKWLWIVLPSSISCHADQLEAVIRSCHVIIMAGLAGRCCQQPLAYPVFDVANRIA